MVGERVIERRRREQKIFTDVAVLANVRRRVVQSEVVRTTQVGAEDRQRLDAADEAARYAGVPRDPDSPQQPPARTVVVARANTTLSRDEINFTSRV